MNTATKTRVTNTERRAIAAIFAQAQIMEYLGWGELYYCSYKYNQGLAYLGYMTKGNDQAFSQMERSRIFWNWWKNHWTLRDEAYLRNSPALKNIQMRRVDYRSLHHVGSLTDDRMEDGIRLESSYAEMIGLLHDELVGAVAGKDGHKNGFLT